MFCNRGIYHKGWTRRDAARHAVGWRALPSAGVRRRRLGAVRRATRTGRRRKNLAEEDPKKLHELQRLWLIEATKYNVLPLDDRHVRTVQRGPRRSAHVDQGQHADLCSAAWDACRENSRRDASRTSRTPMTAEIEVPRSGAEGVIIAQGGRRRRLEPLREGRQAQVLLQLLRHRSTTSSKRARRFRPASTRCEWSSSTTAAGSRRAAT